MLWIFPPSSPTFFSPALLPDMKRLQKEMKEFQDKPLDWATVSLINDNLSTWRVTIVGPVRPPPRVLSSSALLLLTLDGSGKLAIREGSVHD